MLPHLIAIVAFALLCGAWVWLQGWIRRRDPDVRGPESGCGSCAGDRADCTQDSRCR